MLNQQDNSISTWFRRDTRLIRQFKSVINQEQTSEFDYNVLPFESQTPDIANEIDSFTGMQSASMSSWCRSIRRADCKAALKNDEVFILVKQQRIMTEDSINKIFLHLLHIEDGNFFYTTYNQR